MFIEKQNEAFFLTFPIKRGDERQVLFLSDIHLDSKKCNRKKLAEVMDEALRRGAAIVILGDLYDSMQGRMDFRGSKSDLLPRYQVSNYYEAIIEDGAEFLKKYKNNIVLISEGNHETAITKRHEINLLNLTAYLMKDWKGMLGDYEGWLKVFLRRNSANPSKTVFYSHGTGGNAPVTRGVIGTNRRQVSIEADIYITGHIHTQFSMPIPRRRLLQSGREELYDTLHLQLGTFKESHKSRSSWEAQKGFAPPSIGGFFVHFIERRDQLGVWEERTNW